MFLKTCIGALALAAALAGCGGGGGGGSAAAPGASVPPNQPSVPVPPTVPGTPASTIPAGLWQADASALPKSGNYIYMKSEMGDLVPDFIGAGQAYLYTTTQPEQLQVSVKDGHITFGIYNAKSATLWTGDFQAAGKPNPLPVGYYANAHRYPFQAATENGIDITHQELQRGCNQSNGWFTVDKIEYAGDQVAALDLRFEQHCEGNVPALHGQIRWTFDTSPRPRPGPTAPPAGLWQANAAQLPVNMNYAYLESDLGDYTADFYGNPTSRLFTARDAVFQLDSFGKHIDFRIRGDVNWDAMIEPPPGQQRLQTGYYGDLGGIPGDTQGYMTWNGPGATGGTRQGGAYQSWLVVDSIVYEGDTVVALDLRFEQHGGGMKPAVRGQVHWRRADTTAPPGPVNPPPANLWRPPADVAATAGNYVYVQSEEGDFVERGATMLYTPANADIALTTRPSTVEIRVNTADLSIGTFQGVIGVDQLQPGYYGELQAVNRANPAKGGLDWSAHSRGCERQTGWYVVDHIAYANGTISALDLRFEQRCDGFSGALRGAIHWTR